MEFVYVYEGQEISITLEELPDGNYQAKIGNASYHFTTKQMVNGKIALQFANDQFLTVVSHSGNKRFVQLDGVQYELALPDRNLSRDTSRIERGELTAQMPGQVVELMVQEGDTVRKGQTLLTLEAMKMEIRVSALFAGRVSRLHVMKGDTVDRGQVLGEIE